MEIRKIYFDMDNTLADFDRGIREICGITDRPPRDLATEEQDVFMWSRVREAGDFYYRLEECEYGMELLRLLHARFGNKVEILTALPKPHRHVDSARTDKEAWVRERIGDDITVNCTGSSEAKTGFALDAGCILIDDYAATIDSWRAAGGTAILFSEDPEERPRIEEELRRAGLMD